MLGIQGQPDVQSTPSVADRRPLNKPYVAVRRQIRTEAEHWLTPEQAIRWTSMRRWGPCERVKNDETIATAQWLPEHHSRTANDTPVLDASGCAASGDERW